MRWDRQNLFVIAGFVSTYFTVIALIRDDVKKISRNVKPRLGGDRFAWFVEV